MKKVRRFFMIAMLFTGIMLGSHTAEAQGTNPPPPPGGTDGPTNGTGGDTPLGGTAPVGGGVAMLLAMGAAYGGKKYYDYRKKLKNEIVD